jgi:hypothetical protein
MNQALLASLGVLHDLQSLPNDRPFLRGHSSGDANAHVEVIRNAIASPCVAEQAHVRTETGRAHL